MISINKIVSSFVVSLFVTLPAFAGELEIPNQFTGGTPAVAADVNANFSAVEIAVDGNAIDIAAVLESISDLQAANATMQADMQAMQTTIDTLDTTVASLEADNAEMQNFIAEVLPFIEGSTDAQGHPAIVFSGVNVHVNNGEGASETVNGRGNIIVGYNEEKTGIFSLDFCTQIDSNGTAYSTQEDCESNQGVWGTDSQKIGSHTLIVGPGHTYTQSNSLVTGKNNVAAGANSSVNGGESNIASGVSSRVGGGFANYASAAYANVSGGFLNIASGLMSSISGGNENEARGEKSSVNGGEGNRASGLSGNVSGGHQNVASGNFSSVSGGTSNAATEEFSSVSGGAGVFATGSYDWAAGSLYED